MFRKILFAFACACATLSGTMAFAQSTGTQTYNVVVPTAISITAPSAITINHDQSDNPQAFPAQSWVVKGNARSGVNVQFALPTPFVHTEDPNSKRDARLDLAVGATQGPGAWTVSKANDTTNYLTNDLDAVVAAASNGVGRANLNLTVTFVGGEFGLFAAGTYATTVTGTVSAN